MKEIATQNAVGHVLCHDLTQIVPGEYKGARFRKGHVVTEEDIPVLLSMGKEHLYVWEMEPGMLHENEAAERLLALTQNENMTRSEAREGKIELFAAIDGVFLVDTDRLNALNAIDEITVATRRGGFPVQAGDKLAGMRVIPLVISEAKMDAAKAAAGETPLLSLLPYRLRTAAIITTGSEVFSGRIEDQFTPVLTEKLKGYGISVVLHTVTDDQKEHITAAIRDAKAAGVDVIFCTGGMSVDPDDRTPGAILESGAAVVTYGAPVLPGAMLMLGYFEDGTPILGLPGCVMYAKATVLDLVLPRIAAGVRLQKRDFVTLGEGGLCLGCKPCTFPHCPFGR
ncbi:MAG: molybdopterin-binding protein [Clostridia bacterium]|nr:molybdopterin-binding protein [Clostridia bacterium]